MQKDSTGEEIELRIRDIEKKKSIGQVERAVVFTGGWV